MVSPRNEQIIIHGGAKRRASIEKRRKKREKRERGVGVVLFHQRRNVALNAKLDSTSVFNLKQCSRYCYGFSPCRWINNLSLLIAPLVACVFAHTRFRAQKGRTQLQLRYPASFINRFRNYRRNKGTIGFGCDKSPLSRNSPRRAARPIVRKREE